MAFDLSTLTYNSKTFALGTQESSARGVYFKSDGLTVYITGEGDDEVNQYSLSSAWDVSTMSFVGLFDYSTENVGPKMTWFKSDGTKMYMLGTLGTDRIYQYSLSTAWDVTSASYDSVSFSPAAQDDNSIGLYIKSDGTKFYVSGSTNDTVYQYSMSSAWDMSTASYDSVSFSVASELNSLRGLTFSDDGTKMYVVGGAEVGGADTVYQYTLGTAWNVSTASYDSVSLNVNSQAPTAQGLAWGNSGDKFYVIEFGTDAIYQYDSPAASTFTPKASFFF